MKKSDTFARNKVILLALLFFAVCIALSAQETNTKLIGTWELRTHVLYSGDTCGPENKMEITFNENLTYAEKINGYVISGKWKIVDNKIMYYNSVLQNPKDGSVADHSYAFHFSSKGELVEEDYVCSELGGTSYYKKKK